jgi:hypothetical protein
MVAAQQVVANAILVVLVVLFRLYFHYLNERYSAFVVRAGDAIVLGTADYS